ncbi:heterokaryon incompatibility domain-containing protein [Trichoderma velutinum]
MRLINVRTLKLQEFIGSVPPYAILSHTWGKHEISLQSFQTQSHRLDTSGFAKIQATCRLARNQGLDFVWVDTCCIDKTSSAELGEAINSMFKWYQDAAICYAFLEDVSAEEVNSAVQPIGTPQALTTTNLGLAFSRSRWFTRGWTLQELIAPRRLEFVDTNWKVIGEKKAFATPLQDITGIDAFVIEGGPLEQVSVARRMSWAAHRETTRQEDIAYSLFGIFGVNMPLIYGEGPKAFLRLQEEILKQSDDHTLFAWRAAPSSSSNQQIRGLFASSPAEFENFLHRETSFTTQDQQKHYKDDYLIRLWDSKMTQKPITMTNKGIQITGRVQDIRANVAPFDTVILVLNCCFGGDPRQAAGIYLRRQDEDRYARIRPDELAIISPQDRYITQLTLYGLRQDTDIRGHHYDQPWATSYQIRFEVADSDLSRFEDIASVRRKYTNAFYIRGRSLRHWTVFGQCKLHGVLITNSHGLLRFFPFDPDTKHFDMVLKTYHGFRAMLLFKADGSSDWILIILGRKSPDKSGSELWMDAMQSTQQDYHGDSSQLLNALKTCKEIVTNPQIHYLNIFGGEKKILASLEPKLVEGIPMSEVRLSGPWPTNMLYAILRILKLAIFRIGLFIFLIGGLGNLVSSSSSPSSDNLSYFQIIYQWK